MDLSCKKAKYFYRSSCDFASIWVMEWNKLSFLSNWHHQKKQIQTAIIYGLEESGKTQILTCIILILISFLRYYSSLKDGYNGSALAPGSASCLQET